MVKLDLMSGHLKECDFNPKKPVSCSKGCGLTVPKDEVNFFEYDFIESCCLLIRIHNVIVLAPTLCSAYKGLGYIWFFDYTRTGLG